MANYACIPYLITREFDDQGQLLAFGKVYTYQAGTTIPLQTYADAGGFATNLNPVVLDASGSANIFLKGQAYKFVFKDANDNLIRTIDNVLGSASASGGSMVVVSNYAALRALTTDFDVVVVLGRDTPDDGGYGVFEQVPFTADDDGIVLNRALVTSYKRQFYGNIDPRWFGVVYGSATAQNAAVTAAQAASTALNPVEYTGIIYLNSISLSGYAVFNGCSIYSPSGAQSIDFSFCTKTIKSIYFANNITPTMLQVAECRSSWFQNYTTWLGVTTCSIYVLDSSVDISGQITTIATNGWQKFRVDARYSSSSLNLLHASPQLTIGRFDEIPLGYWISGNIPAYLSFSCAARPEWFVNGSPSDWSQYLKAAMISGRVELSQTYNITTPTTFPSAVVSSAIPSGVTGQSTFSGPALRFLANCTIPQLTANGIELYADATSRLTVTTLCATECFFNSSLVPLAFATTTAYLENCLTLAGISGVVKKSNCRQTGLDLWDTTDANVTSLYMVYDKRIIETVSGGITITDATSSNVIADNSAGNISLNMAASTLTGVSYRRVIAYTKANTVTITGTFWDGTSTVGSVTLGGANSVWADFIPRAGGWYILRGA